MLRLLHTADWQLGLRLVFVPGDRGADVRLARFRTVERIAAVARTREVDAVLVAGDVFDDNAVGPDVLQRAADVLARFAPIPVYLLPGNHDAGTPDCALRRLPPQGHVHVLLERDAVALARGALLFPCPLRRRHERDDPTRHLAPRGDDRSIRIVMAHGSALEFDPDGQSPNRIDVEALVAKGFDYVALGDWHGTRAMHRRVWYAGTPEATRFEETDPGHVLIVECEGPGAVPKVEKVRVNETHWLVLERQLESAGDVEALGAELGALPERSKTLVRLVLVGSLPLETRAALERMLEDEEQKLLYLRVEDSGLLDAPCEGDFENLRVDGFVRAAVERLRASTDPVDRDALRLFHRLLTTGGRR